MATELDPGPINPTIGFLPRIGVAEGSEHFIWVPPPPPPTHEPPPPHSSASSEDTSESRMNSMLCSRATAECQHESRISQPRVMLGRILGSELMRSRVCIMASTRWMPYCSRTAPHLRSCTCEKREQQNATKQTGQADVELEINVSKSVCFGVVNVLIDKTILISKTGLTWRQTSKSQFLKLWHLK